MRNYLFIPLLLVLFAGCSSHHGNNKLVSNDTIPLFPKSDTSTIEKNNELIAFVGERIDVKELPYEPGSMDGGFQAKYKVLLRVYGSYAKDTIEFTAYDHYGWPPFAKFKNVLLFVVKSDGKYYHEKYLYFDVYETKNGRWASPYKQGEYEHPGNKSGKIKPEIIDFDDVIYYPLYKRYKDGTVDTMPYFPPYYKIQDEMAIAVYGNYLEDLFALEKNSYLAARDLFDKKYKDEKIEVQDVIMEEIPESNKKPVKKVKKNTTPKK